MDKNLDKSHEKRTILYLCDGRVPDCQKTACYEEHGECQHTTDVLHARNKEGTRHFVPDELGNLWEE